MRRKPIQTNYETLNRFWGGNGAAWFSGSIRALGEDPGVMESMSPHLAAAARVYPAY